MVRRRSKSDMNPRSPSQSVDRFLFLCRPMPYILHPLLDKKMNNFVTFVEEVVPNVRSTLYFWYVELHGKRFKYNSWFGEMWVSM